jgi:hypothetical protein
MGPVNIGHNQVTHSSVVAPDFPFSSCLELSAAGKAMPQLEQSKSWSAAAKQPMSHTGVKMKTYSYSITVIFKRSQNSRILSTEGFSPP